MKKIFAMISLVVVFFNPVEASDSESYLPPIVTIKTLRKLVSGAKVCLDGQYYQLHNAENTSAELNSVDQLFEGSWMYTIQRDDFGYEDGKFKYEIGKSKVSDDETFHPIATFRLVRAKAPLIPQTWADV